MTCLDSWINSQPSRMAAYRALARAAGCTWQQPQKWVTAGIVPVRKVAAISRMTGIAPADLNPIFYEVPAYPIRRKQQKAPKRLNAQGL